MDLFKSAAANHKHLITSKVQGCSFFHGHAITNGLQHDLDPYLTRSRLGKTPSESFTQERRISEGKSGGGAQEN